jgi:uncharacterized membrane protein
VDGILVGLALTVAGALTVWLSWLGSQRRLPPNGVAGIRLPATRRSDEAWYAAHQAAAGPLGVGGGATAACGVGVLFTGLDVVGWALVVIALAALTTAIGLATAVALRAANEA